MISETQGPQDDFPRESWLHIRVLPDDVPGAIRMRHWLKTGLRHYHIRAVRLTGESPHFPSGTTDDTKPDSTTIDAN